MAGHYRPAVIFLPEESVSKLKAMLDEHLQGDFELLDDMCAGYRSPYTEDEVKQRLDFETFLADQIRLHQHRKVQFIRAVLRAWRLHRHMMLKEDILTHALKHPQP